MEDGKMGMNETKQAWGKVGDELSGLGLKLKYHVQAEFAEEEAGPEVKAALQRLAEAIDDTVDAVGNAAKDDAVREDLRTAGQALVDALSTTVDGAVSGIRNTRGK
jgi:hypothetical protein